MVIDYFDFERVAVAPSETDPKLIIDTDTVLTGTVSAQRFEPVPRRNPQVAQSCSTVQHGEFAHGDAFNGDPTAYTPTLEQCSGFGVEKGANHSWHHGNVLR